MFRFFSILFSVSIGISLCASFMYPTQQTQLTDPEIYARQFVQFIRTKDSAGLNSLCITPADFQRVLEQFKSSGMMKPEDLAELPDTAELNERIREFSTRFQESYTTIQTYFKNKNVDVSTLDYEYCFFEAERRKREPVITSMDISIRMRDTNNRYYMISLDKVFLIDGTWKGGFLAGTVTEIDQYNDRLENDYTYGDDSAVTDSVAVADYYDEEVVVADTAYAVQDYGDYADVPYSKKQQKIYRKIDKLYDKAHALTK